MDKTLGEFVSALRKADLEVSPAETLDAMAALDIVGFEDKVLLKNSLSIVLAKTEEEKRLFDTCFDRFFSFNQFASQGEAIQSLRSRMGADGFSFGSGEGRDDSQQPEQQEGQRRRRGGTIAHFSSRLGHMLLEGDQVGLSLAMAEAAEEVHLDQIKTLRERSLYTRRMLLHMGISQLDGEIERLKHDGNERAERTAEFLVEARSYLTEQVRDFVEAQYLLIVDGSGTRFITEAVSDTKLTNMQSYYFDHVKEVVRKLAHQLAKRHAKKKRITNRGALDVRRTLRHNLAYDGTLFDIHWKQIKQERPKVFVICDVSGSVKTVARFLLTFLYSLNEVLPKVRSFVFSNELGEVSELFDRYTLEEAIDISLTDYGKGTTDYGRAFRDFKALAMDDVDNRSTIIILGDARNNYYDTDAELLKEIAQKARQTIWLNPETKDRWDVGDAVMKKYAPHCTYAAVCNSLKDLEKIVGQVLKSTQ